MSTRQLTTEDASVTDSYVYDAFGVVLDQAGVTANNYLFSGEQFDPNVEFYYLRARYYNQENGRFVAADPWQGNVFEPVTLHKYLYAGANPSNNHDPSGYLSLSLNTLMTTIAISSVLARRIIYLSLSLFSELEFCVRYHYDINKIRRVRINSRYQIL